MWNVLVLDKHCFQTVVWSWLSVNITCQQTTCNAIIAIPTSERHYNAGKIKVRLGYCFTTYQRLWLYKGAPLVAFYDTLGIRRMYSRLQPPASSRGGKIKVRLRYCFTPYQRLWLYNGAPLVAFSDTLGIRRMYSRLKPPASSRGKTGKHY